MSRQLRIPEFVLEKPDVLLEKGKDGRFNIDPKAPSPDHLLGAETTALLIRDSAVRGRIVVSMEVCPRTFET